MRLYLSSFNVGNRPEDLVALLHGRTKVAIILNATDGGAPDKRPSSLEREMLAMNGLGLEAMDLDLRDYFGRSEALRNALQGFDIVWVRGGNCFVLRRAFKQSGADEILKDMLIRDAIVYAGYSAAICMLTPSMHGCELVDPPDSVPEGYDSEIIWEGLGLLPYGVAPHYRSNHPESADVEKMVQYYIDNHIPFKALRDGEAIVVDGDREWIAT